MNDKELEKMRTNELCKLQDAIAAYCEKFEIKSCNIKFSIHPHGNSMAFSENEEEDVKSRTLVSPIN